jgi:hypothetical protein
VPQSEIVIGVPAYRDPREVGLVEILKLPFTEERPAWQPQGGSIKGINHRDAEAQLKP